MSKGRMQSKQHGQFKFSQFGFLFLSSKSAKSKNENSGVHEALAKREMPPGQTEKLKQRWTRDHRQGREPTHPPSTVFRIDIPGKPRSTILSIDGPKTKRQKRRVPGSPKWASPVANVRNHTQPQWPSHGWANSKSIFFCIGSSPFMPESLTPRVRCSPERPYWRCSVVRAVSQLWQRSTVHEGFNSYGM